MEVDRTLALEAGERGPVLIRTAHDDLGLARLQREAERLAAASHPGVVELLAHHGESSTIAWCGADTLETVDPPPERAAEIVATLASTVGDLHGIGLIHGRIEPSHVIIGGDGRARLGGMRGRDPDEPTAMSTDDVAGLGALLERLIGMDPEVEPIPERRWSRRRSSDGLRKALQTIAERATDPDPAARPTARRLAEEIDSALPRRRPSADPSADDWTRRNDQHADRALAEPAVVETTSFDHHADAGSVRPAAHGTVSETSEPNPVEEGGWRFVSRPSPPVGTDGSDGSDLRSKQVDPAGMHGRSSAGRAVGSSDDSNSEADGSDRSSSETDRTGEAEEHSFFLGMRVEVPESADVERLDTEGRLGRPQVRHPGRVDTDRPDRGPARSASAARPLDRPGRQNPVLLVAAALVVLGLGWVTFGSSRAPVASGSSAASGAVEDIAAMETESPSTEAGIDLSPTEGHPEPQPDAEPNAVVTVDASDCPGGRAHAVHDLDGDGCPDDVVVVGTEVVTATHRYAVGEAGDLVSVGDWDCDGVSTVGLLRPATGEVFTFPDWAMDAGELTVGPRAVVPDAASLQAPAGGEGCLATLQLTDGTIRSVDLATDASVKPVEGGR